MKWIQQKLELTQTGVYDIITLNAVMTFQQKIGVEKPDGVADEATVAALAELKI